MARGRTCSNLSRRIWRCSSHRLLASCAYVGRTCNSRIARVIRNRIVFPCYGVSPLYIPLHHESSFGRTFTAAKRRLAPIYMNVHMLLGRAAVAAVFVGTAAMASAQNTQNGGIDYDT